jgi:OFA family oxalate/formate antiporter-like MFS transporter
MACQMGAGLFYASRALSPDVIADLGWTRTMWSSAMAPMLLVSSVAQAFVGSACIRFGVRPVVVSGLVCIAASFLVMSGMQELWHFYVAVILLALGNAGIGDVSIGGVITRWFDRNRGLALGAAFVGSNLGAVLFVQAIVGLSSDFAWRTATLAVGVGGIALLLPLAFFVVRDPLPGESESPRLDASAPDAIEEESAGPRDLSLGPALRTPAFWILFYTLFCYALVQLGMYDHLILYLTDIGYSFDRAAGALELAVGAGIVSKIGAGLIVPRISAKTALVVNTMFLTGGLALVPYASNPQMLVLFGILFGVSTSARDVLVPLAVANAFGARYFSQIYGAMMLAYIPGGVLGPLALAAAHDLLGTYRPGFFACLALMATALLGVCFIPRAARTETL